MKIDRTIVLWIVLGLLIVYALTCNVTSSGNFTGLEYMPDMAHSRAYDTYYPSPGAGTDIEKESGNQQIELLFADGKVAREPVAGTVSRGQLPYAYPNSEEGIAMARAELVNPYANASADVLEAGKKSYTVYCAVCHGDKGLGKGSISALSGGPFAGVINYMSAAYLQMEEGEMFHSLQYGKGNMGSYASQLTADERWKVIAYVKSLQADYAAKENKLSKEEAAQFVRGSKGGVGLASAAADLVENQADNQKNESHDDDHSHEHGDDNHNHGDDHSNDGHH